jgi:GNAT superfamily N-acetyltransferase
MSHAERAAPTIDAAFSEPHVLADGTRVTLRLIREGDGPALRAAFARLSPMSRYRRFLTDKRELSDEAVHYLTATDGVHHLAVVATTDSHDLKAEIGLGVARFIRLEDEPEVAEAAVTVIDDAQGKGIARLLLRVLTQAARERGIRTFRAEVLATNTPMRRILDEVGAVVREDDGATLIFDVPLEWQPDVPPPPNSEHLHPLRRLLRAAAESLSVLGGPESEG